MAETAGAQAEGAAGGGARKQVVEWIVSALPAIAGSISFVGFVAALGAAITWVRFAAAQLPADQAIGKIPKSDLVGIGAVSLVAFLVLGLLAVLLVYLLRHRPYAEVSDSVRDLEDDLERARRRAAALDHDLTQHRAQKEAGSDAKLVAQRTRAYDEVADLEKSLLDCETETYGESFPPPTLANQAGIIVIAGVEIAVGVLTANAHSNVKAWYALTVAAAVAAVIYLPFLSAAEGDKPEAVLGQAGLGRSRQAIASTAQLFVVAGVLVLGAAIDIVVLYAGIAALLLAAATIAIGRIQPRRFFWYGFAIFASVAMFGAALEGIRTVRDPSVQPLGVVMKDGREVSGLYVTETKDRLYMARVEAKTTDPDKAIHQDGRLFWLPRDNVRAYSVGPLEHVKDAGTRARQLAHELTTDIAPPAPAAQQPPAQNKTQTGKPASSGGP